MNETAAVSIEQFPEISPGWGWMLLIYYLIESKRHRTIANTTKNTLWQQEKSKEAKRT